MKYKENGVYRFVHYLLHMFEGTDGKLSGKRFLGTFLIISGSRLAWYGVIHCLDHLADVTMLVSSLLAGGLAFWGITAWANMKDSQMNRTIDSTITDGKVTQAASTTISTATKTEDIKNA